MKGKRLLTLLLVIVMAVSFTACGGSSSGSETSEPVIFNIATTNGVDSLSFFKSESSKVADWHLLVYDTLLDFDENYNAVPNLATSWENNGNDWTFHLRDDAVFTDGEKLTSADVKYTYEAAANSYLYSVYAQRIESIDCPDETTVVFHCSDSKPDMLYQNMPIIPKHVWEAQDDPLTYEPENIIGSGPFVYSPDLSGNGVTAFTKNPDYWGDQPKIDTLVFTEYDNSGAMAQAMKIGEVDACYSLEKTQYDDLAGTEGIEVGQFDAWGFEYMGYNLLDKLLADKTIRHAIDYCTDVDKIIEMSYGGIADVAYGPVNNIGFKYEPKADVKRGFNIDKANEILDAAGYKDTDNDGIREKDGDKLSFELITASHRSSWQTATVNSLIENCAKAGIEIKWNAMEVATMWDTVYDGNPDWQISLDGWSGTMDPGYILQLFIDWQNGGSSGCAYSNPEFDKLYYEIFACTDASKRAELIDEAQAIVYEDCPYTYLCYDKVLQCINSDKWTGYKSYGNGFFWNLSKYNYTHIEPKA